MSVTRELLWAGPFAESAGMPQPLRILLVEDEPTIADTLIYALKTEGFAFEWVSTGEEALEKVFGGAEAFALVVLDVGLPGISGFDVCRKLRTRSQVPVLFLTARQSEIDRVVGLEIGGDDYVVKPFSPREVTARIRAILRRVVASSPTARLEGTEPSISTWAVDEERCQIRYMGELLSLTRNEFRLLKVLISKPGRVFSREALMNSAWEDPGASMDRTVDAHIKSLRIKIRAVDPEAEPIETHRGLGYSLKEEARAT